MEGEEIMEPPPTRALGGPGWYRMWSRLGPARMEEMRLAVVREREAALREAGHIAPFPPASDRESCRGYPSPAPRRGKKGRRMTRGAG